MLKCLMIALFAEGRRWIGSIYIKLPLFSPQTFLSAAEEDEERPIRDNDNKDNRVDAEDDSTFLVLKSF